MQTKRRAFYCPYYHFSGGLTTNKICVSDGNSQNYATRQTATKFGYVFILLLAFLLKSKHIRPNTLHVATNPVNP
jgi:hypothetical protein